MASDKTFQYYPQPYHTHTHIILPYIYEVKNPFWYAGCRAILNDIPDAEDWYAGSHFWSKLDSDAMHSKVITILEPKQSNFIKSSAETYFGKHNCAC